jgi:hypothetical protein
MPKSAVPAFSRSTVMNSGVPAVARNTVLALPKVGSMAVQVAPSPHRVLTHAAVVVGEVTLSAYEPVAVGVKR